MERNHTDRIVNIEELKTWASIVLEKHGSDLMPSDSDLAQLSLNDITRLIKWLKELARTPRE